MSNQMNLTSTTSKTTKTAELANAIFKQNIDFSGISDSIYPKYKLVNGGDTVMIELAKDKFKSFGAHHIGPDGVLCDDLETFVKWEMFS